MTGFGRRDCRSLCAELDNVAVILVVVEDRILARAQNECVRTFAAIKSVSTVAAIERVITCAAVDSIITCARVNVIITTAADNAVSVLVSCDYKVARHCGSVNRLDFRILVVVGNVESRFSVSVVDSSSRAFNTNRVDTVVVDELNFVAVNLIGNSFTRCTHERNLRAGVDSENHIFATVFSGYFGNAAAVELENVAVVQIVVVNDSVGAVALIPDESIRTAAASERIGTCTAADSVVTVTADD